MNYPKLNANASEIIRITDFCDSEAENIEFSEDSVTTRPSVWLSGGTVGEAEETRVNEFCLTNAAVFSGGKYNRLTSLFTALGSYSYRYSFCLVSVMGEVTSAGSIEYSIGADGTVRIPQSIYCFSARCIKGAGIFAFIRLDVSSAEGSVLEAYELSSNLKEWVKIEGDEMYIPTYLLNGRGDYFNLCEDKIPEPEYKESLNMLNGICNCYFTTDGFSSSFHLPIESNASKPEHIRVELLADIDTTLYFTFPENSFVSNSVEYNGQSVSLSCNGKFLRFFGLTPQRVYGADSNLKITIKHETAENYAKKANMSDARWYQLSSSGSQAVLTGNPKYKSLTLISYPDNPLYFPESLSIYSGNDGTAVTATAQLGGKLFIFKEDAIFKAEIKASKYTLKQICGSVGVRWGSTVKGTDNCVIFMGSDNKVYVLSPDDTVREISQSINRFTKLLYYPNTVFSAVSTKHYMLFADNTAFALNLKMLESKKYVWSRWVYKSDLDIIDGFSFGENTALLCKTVYGSTIRYYPVMMASTDEDYYFVSRSATLERKKAPISIKMRTPVYNPENAYCLKSFSKAVLSIYSKGEITVSFIGDNGAILRTMGINISCEDDALRLIRLYPLIHSVGCSIEITADGIFTLQGVTLEYYEFTE